MVEELGQNNDDPVGVAVSKTLPFVSNPEMSCLLAASLRLWEVNLLVCT